MLVWVVAGTLVACEPYCAEPCTELNGEVWYECNSCASDRRCHPGASDYPSHRTEAASTAHIAEDHVIAAAPSRLIPRALSHAELEDLKAHLTDNPSLAFLGPWRGNVSFLEEANLRLIRGEPVVFENFLDPLLAEAMFAELNAPAHWPLDYGSDGGDPGAEREVPFFEMDHDVAAAYASSSVPSSRCDLLHRAMRKRANSGEPFFHFRYHIASATWPGPATAAVQSSLAHPAVANAMHVLFSGTPAPERTTFGELYIRSFERGDYVTMHDDAGPGRELCLNYYLTKGWLDQWGGNFLWCGEPPFTGGSTSGARVPPTRMSPGFNEANLFQPRRHGSQHAVEVVHSSADPKVRRLSFTAWMGVLQDLQQAGEVHDPQLLHLQELRRDEAEPLAVQKHLYDVKAKGEL
jgi:hypothetical protein